MKVKKGHIRRKPKHMRHINWRTILLSIFITAFSASVWIFYIQNVNNEARLTNKLQIQKQELDKKIEELNKTNSDVQELQKLKQDLEAQLQAKLEAKKAQTVYAATLPQKPVQPPQSSARGNCGDNVYKQYIYQKESGCRTTAVNSIGCRGIGQACPGSKLPCGDDFACQDAWFSNYAQTRYNGWKGAYEFWLRNHWW